MKEVDSVNAKNSKEEGSLFSPSPARREIDADTYYSVENEDGTLRCSCGRELEKLDESTYRCSGGYPTYRFDDDSVFIDKFGNLMAKKIEHGEKNG